MNERILCSKENGVLDTNFFLILQDGRLVHSQRYSTLSEIVYFIEKRLNPTKTYEDYAISKENLQSKVINRLKAVNLRLYDLNSGQERFIEQLSDTGKLYVVHSTCSSCELRSMFSSAKIESYLDEKKIIIIFSALAGVSDLSKLKKEMNIDIPIYIDDRDEFDLLSVMMNPKDNSIIIESGDNISI